MSHTGRNLRLPSYIGVWPRCPELVWLLFGIKSTSILSQKPFSDWLRYTQYLFCFSLNVTNAIRWLATLFTIYSVIESDKRNSVRLLTNWQPHVSNNNNNKILLITNISNYISFPPQIAYKLIEAGRSKNSLQIQGLSIDGLNNRENTTIQYIE